MQILWARTRPRHVWGSAWNFAPWFPHISRWYRAWSFFFPIFFRRENRLLLRTFFHCLLSGGLVSLRVFCFSIQFCPVQIPLLLIRPLFLSLRDAYLTPAQESEKYAFHVKLQSGRVSLEDRDGKGRVQFDVEDSVMIHRSR